MSRQKTVDIAALADRTGRDAVADMISWSDVQDRLVQTGDWQRLCAALNAELPKPLTEEQIDEHEDFFLREEAAYLIGLAVGRRMAGR